MDEITASVAEGLNEVRAELGPAGDLVLLKFKGRDASPVYEVLKVYSEVEGVNGWRAERLSGQDGAIYTKLSIADVDGELSGVVSGESRAKHFSLGGNIFNINEDKTFRPLTQPLVWTLEGYETEETYP